MKHLALVVGIAVLANCGAAVAADAPPAKTHAVHLSDDEIQLISFMAQQIGARCDISQNGQQFCAAQLRAAALIEDLGKQINAVQPTPPKP
jgi:hypothetical protein